MRPQGACWPVKLPFAFTPRPLLLQVDRGRRHAENECATPGTREPEGAASPVALGAAQSTPEAVVDAKGSGPLSHAAAPAKGTLQPFAQPRTGTNSPSRKHLEAYSCLRSCQWRLMSRDR